jgi:ABC-type multidrug transport system fused ATPase/permease subunit
MIAARTGLIDMIFRKTTVMSSRSRLYYPDGTIFNLMSNDTSRIESALEGLPLLISVPIACVVTVIMLVYLMGPTALLGTVLLILTNPFQAWAMAKLNPIRIKASKLTDKRIHVVTEILQGIKVIKFFTYEPRYHQ